MRLLIVTQKADADDENLGFFHRWLEEFAKKTDEVAVIASSCGRIRLPGNVAVYSLGKERGAGRLRRAGKYAELFSREYARCDAVFFHMIPEFVLAASPFLFARSKPSALWYAHKDVPWKLKIAEKIADHIFTASALSFRLPSKKVHYTGHGIDTDFFVPGPRRQDSCLRLLTVGRISPIKNLEAIVEACALLKKSPMQDQEFIFSIVGGPLMPQDPEYVRALQQMVRDRGLERTVLFPGPRPYGAVAEAYRNHDIFISLSGTGSVDKAVLEAMASGLSVLTANEAFQEILPPDYFLAGRGPELLAERIIMLAREPRPNLFVRKMVEARHSVEKTVSAIVQALSVRTPPL